MSQINEKKVEDAVYAIGQKAATDDAFRELCLNDPKAAVKEATGYDLHEEFNVRFVENEGADLSVVLPDLEEDTDSLSDADLEEVAGGMYNPPVRLTVLTNDCGAKIYALENYQKPGK